MNSVSIVFIEVEKTYVMGNGRLDIIAQVLAECAGMSDFSLFWLQILTTLLACDYLNSKHGHWVPVLAILCDGEKFEFLVYDSAIESVYASRMVTAVWDLPDRNELLAPSLKEGKVANNLHLCHATPSYVYGCGPCCEFRSQHSSLFGPHGRGYGPRLTIFNTDSFLLATEYIFDYFLMGYINGLRSFGHRSELAAKRSQTKKWEWMDALARAEHAHWLCRKAAELAREGKGEEAEEYAIRGIDELKERLVSTQFS